MRKMSRSKELSKVCGEKRVVGRVPGFLSSIPPRTLLKPESFDKTLLGLTESLPQFPSHSCSYYRTQNPGFPGTIGVRHEIHTFSLVGRVPGRIAGHGAGQGPDR